MKARGFSLVELLVVIVMVGILLALSFPSFSSMIRNAKIRNQAEAVLGGLNLAKAEAVRRNKPVSFSLRTDGSGWDVKEFSSADGEGDDTGSIKAYDYKNTADLTIELTQGEQTLTFNTLGRLVAGSSDSKFDVVSSAGGACASQENLKGVRCLRVEVSRAGAVRMCDPAISDGNVQACK